MQLHLSAREQSKDILFLDNGAILDNAGTGFRANILLPTTIRWYSIVIIALSGHIYRVLLLQATNRKYNTKMLTKHLLQYVCATNINKSSHSCRFDPTSFFECFPLSTMQLEIPERIQI